MINVIVIVLCTCLASLGGAFAAVKFKASKTQTIAVTQDEKLETLKTRMISVPIIANNDVQGFLITRIEFVADAEMVKSRQIPAESFVSDEAFKVVYRDASLKFKDMKKHELFALTEQIQNGVNRRIGEQVIKHVFIDTWTYLEHNPKQKADEHADD